MGNVYEESLKKHKEWAGKIEVVSRVDVSTKEKLMLAYTPGVAQPCLEIQKDINKSFELTRRWNTVPVITDGTAILGLGDIGPEAGMPVMEGKCALFKTFGNVDAFPLCINSKDPDEIVKTIKLLAGSFGGINLEDISAPRCFEIETRLKEELNIPVFHDDQHGTAIVVAAGVINSLKVVHKKIEDCQIVINGAGAAGVSIGKFLLSMGAKNVIFVDKEGILYDGKEGMNPVHQEIAKISNKNHLKGVLKDAVVDSDIFIGVSVRKVLTTEMVKTMAKDPIVFACANPVPEITVEEAKAGGAAVVGTGSSAYPNQVNNVLVFPGLFRGALDARAKTVNKEMMIAAAKAIAACIPDNELNNENVIPSAIDQRSHDAVAKAVYESCYETGVAQIPHK